MNGYYKHIKLSGPEAFPVPVQPPLFVPVTAERDAQLRPEAIRMLDKLFGKGYSQKAPGAIDCLIEMLHKENM